jgi:hypothetical protein
MSIKSGRFGQVFYDPTGAGGATLVEVISLNHWTLSKKTEREDVSCFGNVNRVFVPGLPTIEGELEGFWDSAETALFDAADAATPGMLKLVPNRTETGFFWTGLAYMDAEIDVDLNAPTVSGTWAAAGDWTGPVQPPV